MSTAADDEYQRRLFESFYEALVNGSFEEAESTAKSMVEYANDGMDNNPLARFRALQNLAVAQHLDGQVDAAILNYQTAIDEMTVNADRLSSTLITPLRGLAGAYADDGQPALARRNFDRALHLIHVNDGLHSLAQWPILTSIMDMQIQQDENAAALKLLKRIYDLNTRTYAEDSMELLPVLYQQAGTYRLLGMAAEERVSLGQILVAMQHNHGDKDLLLVEPYLQLARNLVGELDKIIFRSGPTAPTAEKYLKRALLIANENPAADWRLKRKCLLTLADYYSLVDMYARANRYYQQTWVLLSSNDAYLSQRATDLEIVVPLSRPRPHPYANFEYNRNRDPIDPKDYLHGEMTMQFIVTKQGRTRDVEVVAENPQDFARMERRVRNSLKNFKYRPRYADGSALETRGHRYTVKYSYLLSEYAASQAKSGKLARRRLRGKR